MAAEPRRPAPNAAGPVRRLVEVAAFVGLWIGIGSLFIERGDTLSEDTGIRAYLLIGIPLTVAFQLWVRRRPIRELWVRDGPGITKRIAFRAIAVVLAIYPLYSLIKAIVDDPSGLAALILFFVAATAGAGAAAYAFTHFTRQTWRYLGLCIATAGVIGVVPYLIGDIDTLTHPTGDHPDQDFWFGVTSFILYVPTAMVMEEVTFRGALDSHAHHAGDRFGFLTAIFVSALWGIWHAPLIGWDLNDVLQLVLYQGAVGTGLSIFWRKSGNLGVSGTTHALIDGLRNASGSAP